MSMAVLPNEIFFDIFNHLQGADLVNCCGVCQRWKDILDSMPSVWEKACKNDYRDIYQDAYSKATLTWQELYISLKLWSEIDSTIKKPYDMSRDKSIPYFKVLQNGIISFPEFKTEHMVTDTASASFGDTISYYNLETLKECRRETIQFDFHLDLYNENEYVKVFVDKDAILHVLVKANKSWYLVDKVSVFNLVNIEYQAYALYEKEIYFWNEDSFICVSKLEETEGDLYLKTVPLIYFTDEIVSFTYINSNHVNILSYDFSIYSLIGNELRSISLLSCVPDLRDELTRCGFNWSSKYINMSLEYFDEIDPDIYKFKEAKVVYLYGDIIITGTNNLKLHIYFKPYDSTGKLIVYRAKPLKTINLKKLFNIRELHVEIQQIDVVEIKNGHKVIVLISGVIFVIELLDKFQFTDGKGKPPLFKEEENCMECECV